MFAVLTLRRLAYLLLFASSAATAIPGNNVGADSAALYEEALIEFNKGEISTSVIHLKNALQADPAFLAGHILLGRSYLEQGYAALAEKEFKLALDYGADRSLVIEHLAQAYLLQLRFEYLLDQIHPGNFPKPVNAALLVARGQALSQLGKLDEALLEFNDAITLQPGNVDALLGQASIELRKGDFANAEQLINLAADADPNNAAVWYNRGALEHAQANFTRALEFYTQALQTDPQHYRAKLARAGVLMDRGDFQQAEQQLRELYAIAPADPQVAYLLGTSLRKNGKAEAALSLMREAKLHLAALSEAVVMAHGPTLFLAGLIHYDLGEFQKAKIYLSSYISRYHRETRARVLLGTIYMHEGAVTKAVNTLEPVLKYGADDYQVLMLLADAYMRLNEYFKASQLFDRAAAVSPDNPSVLTGMGVNDLMRGQKAEGLEGLEEAFELQQQAGSAGFILVTTLLKDGRIADALKIAQRLQQKAPDNPLFSNLLASVYVEAGNQSKARELYQQLLKQQADFYPAQVNLAKLDVLEGKLDVADQRLQQLLVEYPENMTLMVEMARLQLAREDIKSAIQWLEKAHALDSSSVLAGTRLVDLYLRTGQPGKALAVAKKVYSNNYENVHAMMVLGRAELAAGDPVQAQATLKNASQEGGFKSRHLPRIAEYQLQAGDLNGAVYTLEKYVNANPDYLPLKVRLAELLIVSEQYRKAEDAIADLSLDNDNQPLVERLRGDLLLAQGQAEAALTHYQSALTQQPGTELAVSLFRAHVQTGDEKQALQFVADWVSKYPNDNVMRQLLAEGYLQAEQYPQAEQQFEILISKDYRSPMVYNNLAMIYLKNQDSRAEEYARKAYSMLPERPSVLDTLGWILVQKGALSDGLSLLREAHARAADNTEIRYHIAVALLRMGRQTEARIELEHVVSSDPKFTDYGEAQRLFKQLKSQ